LALSDPDTLLLSMIKKVISIINLMKKDTTHELITKYEEEVDKTNLLIHKSIITSLMYRRESKLRHIDLFYIGMLSRSIEQLADILITITNEELINTIHSMMKALEILLENLNQQKVVEYIQKLENLEQVQVRDLESYKEKRVYSLLGHIAEILCDWIITEEVDKIK
jgi:phosphate uptake regulator